jgi:hypothetical protein
MNRKTVSNFKPGHAMQQLFDKTLSAEYSLTHACEVAKEV